MTTVMQVVHVRIKPGMESVWSKATYDRVENWLKNWTCRANFKACISPDEESALEYCRKILRRDLVPSWLRRESGVLPQHFEFEVKGPVLSGYPTTLGYHRLSDYYYPECKMEHADHFEDADDDHDYLGGGH